MKVKNTTRASHSRYYYHFHQIRVVLFINASRTVVFPVLIAHDQLPLGLGAKLVEQR